MMEEKQSSHRQAERCLQLISNSQFERDNKKNYLLGLEFSIIPFVNNDANIRSFLLSAIFSYNIFYN